MRSVFSYLCRFLSDGLPLALLTMPFCIMIRLTLLHARERRTLAEETDMLRELVMYGFFCFLILLSAQTFIYNSGMNELRLVPFQIITEQLGDMNSTAFSRRAFIFNIIGNAGIFVPIGIFIAYLFKKNAAGTALCGFYISLVIETVQLPLDRTTDVDDLILNTAGAVAGYYIYRLAMRVIAAVKRAASRGGES